MSWTKESDAILTPGVDLDLRNATINPIKVNMGSQMPPLYFSGFPIPIDENNAVGVVMNGRGYAITYDSNGNLLDFYYASNAD